MKKLFPFIAVILLFPLAGFSQTDSTAVKNDSKNDSSKSIIDTSQTTISPVITVMPAPASCYNTWYDFMRTRGTKPITDGMQEVVVSFKTAENCVCLMGKVEVAGGKIKAPLYIQTEDGNYKPVSELGKKMDAEFVASMGTELWAISNGMSVLFRTANQEYGRLFFYKFANKGGSSFKEAPLPSDLIKE